jgi:HNH endonuclease
MINIVKSQPAPLCLSEEKEKANGDYKKIEVLERIQADFYNKCYICEDKDITTINVEHFEPHRNDKEKLFDWNNLFYACQHCNNTKSDLAKYHPLLNCTDATHKILDWVRFEYEIMPLGEPKIIALQTDELTQKTVTLIQDVFNGTTPLKTLEARNLRRRLEKEMKPFLDELFTYFSEDDYSEEDRAILKSRIIRKLSIKSPFTAFKVWYIKKNQSYLQEFSQYLPS